MKQKYYSVMEITRSLSENPQTVIDMSRVLYLNKGYVPIRKWSRVAKHNLRKSLTASN